MRIREPLAFIDLSSLSSMTILPALSMRCSSVVNGGPGSCSIVRGIDRCFSLGTYRSIEDCEADQLDASCSNRLLAIRMIAAFPQLHDNIQQPCLSLLLPCSTYFPCQQSNAESVTARLTVDSVDIFLQQHPVPLPLHLSHPNVKIDLLLR